MRIRTELRKNYPNVTVYILEKNKKVLSNSPQTGYQTAEKTPEVTPTRTTKTPPILDTGPKSALLTMYASPVCTDRQTDRQT